MIAPAGMTVAGRDPRRDEAPETVGCTGRDGAPGVIGCTGRDEAPVADGCNASCVGPSVRRGPTIPIARCIDAVRSLTTSEPHCEIARKAAVALSWQSA